MRKQLVNNINIVPNGTKHLGLRLVVAAVVVLLPWLLLLLVWFVVAVALGVLWIFLDLVGLLST